MRDRRINNLPIFLARVAEVGLGSREVPVNYGLEDFQEDRATIQRLALDQ
jgi:hypothetical protein